MLQNCTILCPTDEPARILSSVRRLLDGLGHVTVEGANEDWSSLTIEGDGATLTLNRLVFKQPGDEFGRLKGGMWSYFDDVETEHDAIKSMVLEKVGDLMLAIGVVAEPSFDEKAGHFDCIFGLAEELDAIIWNGSGVLNADGGTILDSAGNSDLEG